MSCSGFIAWRSTWRGSAKKGPPFESSIASSTCAVGTCAQGTGASEPGTAVEIDVGIAVTPAIVDAIVGHALGVEQHRRAAEVEPVGEGLRELAAPDPLAAQDAEHVGLQQFELLRVRILLQELLELLRNAFRRPCS